MYLCHEPAPYINPQYNQRIWDGRFGLENLDYSLVSQSSEFPFPIRFDFSFTEPLVFDENKDEYTYDLGQLISHVDYSLDSNSNRQLPFYPDFLQTDNFSFMVQFDSPVEMIDLPKSIIMGSALGNYRFNVQFENNTLRVFSQLVVDNPKIEVDELSSAAKVYNAIQTTEKTIIRFKTLN